MQEVHPCLKIFLMLQTNPRLRQSSTTFTVARTIHKKLNNPNGTFILLIEVLIEVILIGGTSVLKLP